MVEMIEGFTPRYLTTSWCNQIFRSAIVSAVAIAAPVIPIVGMRMALRTKFKIAL